MSFVYDNLSLWNACRVASRADRAVNLLQKKGTVIGARWNSHCKRTVFEDLPKVPIEPTIEVFRLHQAPQTFGSSHISISESASKVPLFGRNPTVREMRTDGLLPKSTKLRSSKYLNNLIEQDHRGIKSRTKPMLGFKNFRSAASTIAGIDCSAAFTKINSISDAYASKTELCLQSGVQYWLNSKPPRTVLLPDSFTCLAPQPYWPSSSAGGFAKRHRIGGCDNIPSHICVKKVLPWLVKA
ncbi:Mobile element protein [Acidisarcina polymorpha]|uniref:Mobile element protein n=1 Tax=Acidisarcina polymorpha TaxID=2211140 RepID=A0A2Z5FTI9_9BACT|nr:Mobile element protein [Acidisarcina polymorpha]